METMSSQGDAGPEEAVASAARARIRAGGRRPGRCLERILLPMCALAALLAVQEPAAAQVGSPAGPVPVEELEARRAALLDRIGTGVAVLRSAEPLGLEDAYPQASEFRQDNDFFYLTGLETSGAWLVLIGRETGRDRAILYLPERDREAERWTGPNPAPGPRVRRSTGVDEVRSARAALDEIEALVEGADSPARTGGVWLKTGATGLEPLESRLNGAPLRISDLRTELAALRLVKGPDELERLRRAVAITEEAQREAMRASRPGLWEYELEAVIEYTFRRRGAERVGFPSIVASGPNSTILHYDQSRRHMEEGDLVVADIGAEFGYYTADITRTFPVSGRFTPRQRDLYELVLATQQAAIDAVRPGMTLGALSRIARETMRERSGTLCAPVSCDRYFTHGLSHWLGMDVHDVGDYSTPLEAGMVFTIEPGVYLPDEAIGIRIEDDVVVTDDGARVLSEDAPRSVDEIEALMGETPACCTLDPERSAGG